MGQAKLKGSFEQRKAQALERMRESLPASIKCNNCQSELTEIHPMDVRGIPGMRLAGGAVCTSCSQTTWVLDGTPEALRLMQNHMSEEYGGELKTGFAQKSFTDA